MRAVVIGNGTIESYQYIRSLICDDDFIICADGGLRHAEAMGITPDIAIGDFDSAAPDTAVERIVYPARKDCTDGELAVRYAEENGFREILLLAMTGTRLDHTMTDLFLLTRFDGAYLADDHNEIRVLKKSLTLDGYRGRTLSIIPVFGDVLGITTEGLEYPLCDETLYFGESRGNSNVVTADHCVITAREGKALIVINNGE